MDRIYDIKFNLNLRRINLLLLIVFACQISTISVFSAPYSGVALDYPRGRYKESDPPQLFKWRLLHPAHTITLKVYKKNSTKVHNQAEPLGRFDLLSSTQSLKWTHTNFTNGEYIWFIETYNETSDKPIAIASAEFKIDSVKSITEKSSRIGGQAGFSRGQYESNNSSYKVNYDISPAYYGVFYSENYVKNILNINFLANDFVLEELTQNSYSFFADYIFALHEPTMNFSFYAGPTAKAMQISSVVSNNGTNLSRENEFLLLAGGVLFVQKEFKRDIYLHAKSTINFPLIGSNDFDNLLLPINYDLRTGITFELLWPMGFGAEFFYKNESAHFKTSNVVTKINQTDWGVIANVVYEL